LQEPVTLGRSSSSGKDELPVMCLREKMSL
jgi:hypothetical protein